MMSQKEKVGTRTRIDVTLLEDMIGLEDVVVTGYTAMKRKDITGSVASVSAEQIARIPAYDLTTSLVGVAGIRIDGGSIRIRGTRSTNAGNDPLIVLDGIPYDETLTSINPGRHRVDRHSEGCLLDGHLRSEGRQRRHPHHHETGQERRDEGYLRRFRGRGRQ